ncbi:MAG: alpha/beta fold hydrolase [Roseiflexus sp.]
MEHFTSHDLHLSDVRLRLYRGGRGPAVVLAHGLTDHARYWAPLARALAIDYDVIAYDARGHGLSDSSPDGYSLDLLAADLIALVEALGLTQPAVIGHSMGASTAAIGAATHSGMFRCVILEDPPWRSLLPVDMPDMATARTTWQEDLLAMKAMDDAALLARCRAESPGWSDEDYALWVESKRAVNPDVLDVLPSFVRLWSEDVRRIDCPTLILTGDPERGALFDFGAEQIVRQLHPDVQIVRIPGVGHQVRREGFVAYLDAVQHFLQDVRSR